MRAARSGLKSQLLTSDSQLEAVKFKTIQKIKSKLKSKKSDSLDPDGSKEVHVL